MDNTDVERPQRIVWMLLQRSHIMGCDICKSRRLKNIRRAASSVSALTYKTRGGRKCTTKTPLIPRRGKKHFNSSKKRAASKEKDERGQKGHRREQAFTAHMKARGGNDPGWILCS